MSAHGILVLHYTPRRIRSDAARVVTEIRSATWLAGNGRRWLSVPYR
jgi:hypothetical protein